MGDALVGLRRDGTEIPAVAQVTKMGFVFVLDRLTGEVESWLRRSDLPLYSSS